METSSEVDKEIEALTELGQRLVDSILQREPIGIIKGLIDTGAPLWFQNVEEGMSALHAAAYTENEEVTKLLIEEGAPWNTVDNLKVTAGDIAISLNNERIYTTIRDAGIRAELLLTLLSTRPTSESPSNIVLRATDSTAAGSTDEFLRSKLRFTKDRNGQDVCLLNVGDDEVGVMMGWERGIMEKTVKRLCDNHDHFRQGLKILNIGFGLGIIDTLFQSLSTPPSQHVIIEPHPDVLRYMKELGWYHKPGVTVLEGKWQDFMESNELLGVGGFDIIYTDTFSENYADLRQFFETLPDLLAGPESRFSFFNGLGATNALFYDVYTHLAELHLAEVGIDVEWSDVEVAGAEDKDRWGETREYFSMPLYRLPLGRMTSIS